jgi:hypothetical protein
VTSDIQTQINGITASNLPSLSNDAPTTTTTVTDTCKVSTLKFADNSVQTIAFDSTKASDLATAVSDVSTLQSDMTTAQADIATNASAIATKQDILDGTNKLPITSVDLTGSTLVNIDYTSSVSTKFAAIDTTLASQETLNSTTASNISDLSANKQNVLGGTNKLNRAYIDANRLSLTTRYLSSITSDLQTQLDNLGGSSTRATLNDLTVKRICEKID